jgi:hypothetical protein
MKSTKKLLVLFAVIAAAGILAGCASSKPETSAEVVAKMEAPKQSEEELANKGGGLVSTPQWVIEFLMNGLPGVETLPPYEGQNCFVAQGSDKNRDFAVALAANTAGPALVANVISTTVTASAQGAMTGASGEDVQRNISQTQEALSTASFNGVRQSADWWRTVKNTATGEVITNAYVLYTVDKKSLGTQVAQNLQNIVDQNTSMSAAQRAIFADMISQIRSNGVITK